MPMNCCLRWQGTASICVLCDVGGHAAWRCGLQGTADATPENYATRCIANSQGVSIRPARSDKAHFSGRTKGLLAAMGLLLVLTIRQHTSGAWYASTQGAHAGSWPPARPWQCADQWLPKADHKLMPAVDTIGQVQVCGLSLPVARPTAAC